MKKKTLILREEFYAAKKKGGVGKQEKLLESRKLRNNLRSMLHELAFARDNDDNLTFIISDYPFFPRVFSSSDNTHLGAISGCT